MKVLFEVMKLGGGWSGKIGLMSWERWKIESCAKEQADVAF